MFKFKWIFKNRFTKINSEIFYIYKFPNDNILLVGKSIYIYDSNFNLIYSKVENHDGNFMNACIINNDSFIISELKDLTLILYSKTIIENKLNNENNNLIINQYNSKILLSRKYMHQILFFKENNDLICLHNNTILIYDFDKKKNYNIFIKTKLIESPRSNLLLIEDNLFFYTNNFLKIYKLKSMYKDPEKINLTLNINNRIELHEYDKNNIIIKTSGEIIKYNFNSKEIKFRIINEYKKLSITKNYILGINNDQIDFLNKNFDIIQIKRSFFSYMNYRDGIELDGQIVVLSGRFDKTIVISCEKSIIKAIIAANMRYIILGYLCSKIFIICKILGNYIILFNFFNFDFLLGILLVWFFCHLSKEILFNYYNCKSDLMIIPSDFF